MCQKRISKSICDLNTVGKIVGGYILIKMNYENSKLSVTNFIIFQVFRPVQVFTKIVYKDIILFPHSKKCEISYLR